MPSVSQQGLCTGSIPQRPLSLLGFCKFDRTVTLFLWFSKKYRLLCHQCPHFHHLLMKVIWLLLPTLGKLSNNSLEDVYNVKLFAPLFLSTNRTYGHGDISIVIIASQWKKQGRYIIQDHCAMCKSVSLVFNVLKRCLYRLTPHWNELWKDYICKYSSSGKPFFSPLCMYKYALIIPWGLWAKYNPWPQASLNSQKDIRLLIPKR